mgnify:CR=1 FL=1
MKNIKWPRVAALGRNFALYISSLSLHLNLIDAIKEATRVGR